MKRNTDLGLLILRIGMSGLMLTHGIDKLLAFIDGNTAVAGNPLGVGTLITSILVIIGEVVGPILVLIGFKTRIGALLTAITMAVAAFIVHGGDPLAKKELALLYLFGFLAIAIMGAGKLSVDKK